MKKPDTMNRYLVTRNGDELVALALLERVPGSEPAVLRAWRAKPQDALSLAAWIVVMAGMPPEGNAADVEREFAELVKAIRAS